MCGEKQMPSGLTGVVQFIDDAAQIHIKWSNGSTLAIIPDVDSFSIAPDYDNESRLTAITHYRTVDGAMTAANNDSIVITPGLKSLDNIVCLVNTCGDETEFEAIPDHIATWIDQIGIDYGCFPNLKRTWGAGQSQYIFSFHYEIPNEFSDEKAFDRPAIMPYKEQLGKIIAAGKSIAIAIPHAEVRILEMSACYNAHALEISFPYPCEVEKIKEAYELLVSKFDYVWDIGRAEKPTAD